MTTSFKRYFTPAEAKKTLPLVRKIVTDILKEGRLITQIAETLLDSSEIKTHPVILEKAALINTYMQELDEIGCFYKDWNFEFGLVDFPSVIDNQDVFLCWRSDEPDILFYHPIDAGFAGRRPLPDAFLH